VKWDYTGRGYHPTDYDYDHLFDEWPEVGGEEDFEIEPGDGIGIMVQEDAEFTWEPELIAIEGDDPDTENGEIDSGSDSIRYENDEYSEEISLRNEDLILTKSETKNFSFLSPHIYEDEIHNDLKEVR